MKMLRPLIAVILLCVACFVAAEDRSLRIVELRNSLAAPVLEILRPHLPAGAGASAVDNKLLLNLTEAEWQSVQNVIGQLDKPAQRLLVTVQWRRNATADTQATEASVAVDEQGGQVQANSQWQTERDGDNTTQQVHTIAGQTAFIHTGTDIPELTIQLSTRGRLVTGTTWRESGRGFYVLPLVQGDQVVVRVNPRERVPLTDEQGAMRISVLETEVRGALGQWLPLAGSYQAGDTRWQTQRSDWQVQIKVDKLP
jgi:hypothetical protein